MVALRIQLSGIPEEMEPGDAIRCTINGELHDAKFVRYGASHRFIFVTIYGLYEASSGKLLAPPMFPEAHTYTTEFVVNDAPGTDWHRTAGMAAEVAQ